MEKVSFPEDQANKIAEEYFNKEYEIKQKERELQREKKRETELKERMEREEREKEEKEKANLLNNVGENRDLNILKEKTEAIIGNFRNLINLKRKKSKKSEGRRNSRMKI